MALIFLLRKGNALNQSILISAGKENKSDSVNSGERKRNKPNRIPSGKRWGNVVCRLGSGLIGKIKCFWKAKP